MAPEARLEWLLKRAWNSAWSAPRMAPEACLEWRLNSAWNDAFSDHQTTPKQRPFTGVASVTPVIGSASDSRSCRVQYPFLLLFYWPRFCVVSLLLLWILWLCFKRVFRWKWNRNKAFIPIVWFFKFSMITKHRYMIFIYIRRSTTCLNHQIGNQPEFIICLMKRYRSS